MYNRSQWGDKRVIFNESSCFCFSPDWAGVLHALYQNQRMGMNNSTFSILNFSFRFKTIMMRDLAGCCADAFTVHSGPANLFALLSVFHVWNVLCEGSFHSLQATFTKLHPWGNTTIQYVAFTVTVACHHTDLYRLAWFCSFSSNICNSHNQNGPFYFQNNYSCVVTLST